jgi:probable rRNA maturation factor
MAKKAEAGSVAIDVTVHSALWARALPQAAALCKKAATAALAGAKTTFAEAELSIVLSDDAMLRSLNLTYRGQDKPTNVLSFPNADAVRSGTPFRLLGDVVLAFETIARESAEQGKPLANNLSHLVVHGVLHLLGFDHESLGDAKRMEALETRILAGLGIPDPYRAITRAHG